MGDVQALQWRIPNRPASEKKIVVATIGLATMERITWLLPEIGRYSVGTGPCPGKIVSPCSAWFKKVFIETD
jgi:hypothetical protein